MILRISGVHRQRTNWLIPSYSSANDFRNLRVAAIPPRKRIQCRVWVSSSTVAKWCDYMDW
jgi:hypothetical protein